VTVSAAQLNDSIDYDTDEDFSKNAYSEGWTDGLPVVPPTPERVGGLLEYADRDPVEMLGVMPPGNGLATVHAVAVNAVMAGSEPQHFPVILAAIEAVLDPEFNLSGIQATTSPVTPAFMINGPVAIDLEFNSGHDCFGPGTMANAVVGRAVRLCMRNIGYARAGETDMSTQGQPGKYAFCFAENEAASPWEPHSVERGFSPEVSTITAFQAGMIMNILDFGSKSAGSLLQSLSSGMATTNTNSIQIAGGDLALVLCPDHADILGREGWTKDEVKQFLYQNARIPFSAFSPGVQSCIRDWRRGSFKFIADHTLLPIADDWRHIRIVVAGGSGSQSGFIPGFADGFSVTREIQ
jgi:hypothetical protein